MSASAVQRDVYVVLRDCIAPSVVDTRAFPSGRYHLSHSAADSRFCRSRVHFVPLLLSRPTRRGIMLPMSRCAILRRRSPSAPTVLIIIPYRAKLLHSKSHPHMETTRNAKLVPTQTTQLSSAVLFLKEQVAMVLVEQVLVLMRRHWAWVCDHLIQDMLSLRQARARLPPPLTPQRVSSHLFSHYRRRSALARYTIPKHPLSHPLCLLNLRADDPQRRELRKPRNRLVVAKEGQQIGKEKERKRT